MKCSLPLPHGRPDSEGKCLECRRLRAITYRDRERKNKYSPRMPPLSRAISLALLSWRLPSEPARPARAARPNPSHFASDPRTSAIGRMGKKVSPWRFGIPGAKVPPRPEWLK